MPKKDIAEKKYVVTVGGLKAYEVAHDGDLILTVDIPAVTYGGMPQAGLLAIEAIAADAMEELTEMGVDAYDMRTGGKDPSARAAFIKVQTRKDRRAAARGE